MLKKLFERIKWNTTNYNLCTDLERAFSLIYRKECSEKELNEIWEYVIKKNIFAAYCTYRRFLEKGYVTYNATAVQEMIQQELQSYDQLGVDERKIADFLATYVLFDNEIVGFEKFFGALPEEVLTRICHATLVNIEMLSDHEIVVLSMVAFLYKNVSPSIVERALYESKYNFPYYKKSNSMLQDLIRKMINDGNFRLAYLIKKAYNFSMRNISITEDEYVASLSLCENDNFFRGCLLYKEMLDADSDIEKLKRWYYQISKINSDVARNEQSGIRFLFMCEALQLNPKEPEKVMKDIQIRIINLEPIDMNRKQFVKQYRRTIYLLLVNGQAEWVGKFIQKTELFNIDRFTSLSDSRRPFNVINHIGYCDTEELLRHLVNDINIIENAVYIYMNTFIRGIIGLGQFVYFLQQKYSTNVANAFTNYRFWGTLVYDGKREVYYFQPNSVRRHMGDKLLIDKESLNILQSLYFEEGISWFEAKFTSYNPESKVLRFSLFGYGEQRLEKLNNQLVALKRTGIVSEELRDEIHNTNIYLIIKDQSEVFIELCINILDSIINWVDDKDKCFVIMNELRRINFYIYNAKSNSLLERRLSGIRHEQYVRMKESWNRLMNSSMSSSDSFMIYCNTILRRGFCLSDFLLDFVSDADENYRNFLAEIGPVMGYIQVFANSNTKNDVMVILLTPSAFKTRNQEMKYDRFVFEIPKNGESTKSIRKRCNIYTGKPVRFEISEYVGDGVFIAKNLQFDPKTSSDE